MPDRDGPLDASPWADFAQAERTPEDWAEVGDRCLLRVTRHLLGRGFTPGPNTQATVAALVERALTVAILFSGNADAHSSVFRSGVVVRGWVRDGFPKRPESASFDVLHQSMRNASARLDCLAVWTGLHAIGEPFGSRDEISPPESFHPLIVAASSNLQHLLNLHPGREIS